MLIVDTGPLVAAASRSDPDHEACAELLTSAEPPVILPGLVVTEAAYLLGDRVGPAAELAFARSIADGEFVVEPVLGAEWTRISELVAKYLDLPLGIVDASVIALVERHGAVEVATLDRRHFSIVRPRHIDHLTLLPDG